MTSSPDDLGAVKRFICWRDGCPAQSGKEETIVYAPASDYDAARQENEMLRAEAAGDVEGAQRLRNTEDALASRDTEIARLREEMEGLRKQLPDEMQHCTIKLETCAKCERRWLQPTNWINHGCPHCQQEALLQRAEAAESKLQAPRWER